MAVAIILAAWSSEGLPSGCWVGGEYAGLDLAIRSASLCARNRLIADGLARSRQTARRLQCQERIGGEIEQPLTALFALAQSRAMPRHSGYVPSRPGQTASRKTIAVIAVDEDSV